MTNYDIIIQAGQSNAEGCGYGPVTKEFVPSPNAFYLSSEKTVDVIDGLLKIEYADVPFEIVPAEERIINDITYGDFSLTFAEEYEKAGLLKEGRKILIVRAAVGGTGFCVKQWGIGMQLYDKLLEMTEYALNLGGDNRIVAFLWHQGERDSIEEGAYQNYKELLTAQTADFRARYGEVPFIAADFVHDWKSKYWEECERVVQITREITKEIGNAGFVETSDLKSNHQQNGEECTDDIHFCRESLHVLGRRYFDVFQKIKNNK